MRRSGWSGWLARGIIAVLLATLVVQACAQGGVASAAALTSDAPPNASCAQLAAMSPTATNGPEWGKTLLVGFDATRGWFGVPVCANNYNHFMPGGANVSCTRAPVSDGAYGCAPGVATSDGYGLTFECVELVARFAKWAFGDAPSGWHGDAQYLWLDSNHPADFRAFVNGGAAAPVPGDVLVWGSLDSQGHPWPAGPAGGHVAVVESVSAHAVTFVEENMIGHRNGETINIPREQTTLTRTSNGGWLIGPTFGENGGRTLYGWLHTSRNTGRFPHIGAAPGPASATSTPTEPAPTSPATMAPGPATVAPTFTPTPIPTMALPSLSRGVVITGDGALAQVVWSDTRTPLHPQPVASADVASIGAVAESMGAPTGVSFPPNQSPAVLSLPTHERYVFARGNDGALYSVYTAPAQPALYWQFLRAPKGVTLTGSMTALWDQSGMAVGALGSDGAFWMRAGPSGNLGDWVSLGAPAHTTFSGTLALADAPHGLPSPAVTRLVLGLGRDGALYETDSSAPGTKTGATNAGQASGWTQWTKAPTQAVIATLSDGLRLVSEPSASGVALDAISADTTGHLWILRRTSLTQPWTATSTTLPSADVTVVGAVLHTQSTATPPDLEVYVARASPTTAAATNIAEATISFSGAMPARWRPLDGEVTSSSQPTALALDTDGSALLTTTASAVSLLGADTLVHVLLPSTRISSASSGVELGQIPAPGSFNDSFAGASLDPRWVIHESAQTPAVESDGVLTLSAPQSTPRTADIAQAAPSGSFTVTTYVAPGVDWSATTARPTQQTAEAGIQLVLDDAHALSLGLRSNGYVAFCPTAPGASLQCSEAPAPSGGAAASGVYLRLHVKGATSTGEVSRDGQTWIPVGSWTPSWLPSSATEILGPYAPPFASPDAAQSQPFTSVQLYVTRSASASASATISARFSDFMLHGDTSPAGGQ
ncbi:MAG TPA: CHAP domain-containing protein [Ktedonobacterales bacterium]